MSFYLKYTLDRLIADGETKTFRAKENATGRIVFLHLFNPEGKALLATLATQVAKNPLIAPLIELGEFAGSPFAVTEPIEPFTSLRSWLIGKGATPPPAQPDAFEQLFGQPMYSDQPPSKPAPQVSDEFTRMFGAPPPPSTAKPAEPGEFTRLFGDKPGKVEQKPQTGEFTRLFQSGAEPKPTAPLARAPEPDEFEKSFGNAPLPVRKENPLPPGANPNFDATLPTGKFAQFFGSGPSGEAINIEEEQARAARRAVPESRPFQAPGEFTRVFGPQAGRTPGAAPPVPPPTSIGPAPGGSASGLFAVPAGPPPVPRTSADKPKTLSPGEYTRLTAVPKLDPNRGPDPLPPPSSSKRGWIIGLAIGIPVLILIVYLIVSQLMHR